MKYSPYEKLKIDLTELEKINKVCKYESPPETKMQTKKKCNKNYKKDVIKEQNFIFDEEVHKTDTCKELQFKHKTNVINNERENLNNLSYYKNIKQLFPRSISTIPYKNKKTYEYNPELDSLMKSGLLSSYAKSISGTSQIESTETPLISNIKEKIKNKSNLFDISRLPLSTRQLKGNQKYFEYYKNTINSIKNK